MATKAPLVTGGSTGIQEMLATDKLPVANLPVMTATVGGAVPTPPNNTTTFLRGDGTFAAPAGGGGAVATDTIWDAKGDLAVGTGADTASKLTVGSNGKELIADSSEATGLRWGPVAITPTLLSADQDNYNPTDWLKAKAVYLSGDNEIRAITSFAKTHQGDIKTLVNVGDNTIYIPGEHPDGTATNRVSASADYFLHPKSAVQIVYNETIERWVLISNAYYNEAWLHQYLAVNAGSTTASDHNEWNYLASGTGSSLSQAQASFAIPGAATFGTGTTTSGSVAAYGRSVTDHHTFGDMHIFARTFISIPTLSDGTDRFVIIFALDGIPTTVNATFNNNSVGFFYSDNVNSGKWVLRSRNNSGTETDVDSGITVAASQVYCLDVYIDKALTEARYYIDGVFVGRVTGNLPTSGTNCGGKLAIRKSAGTTSRSLYLHRISQGSLFK